MRETQKAKTDQNREKLASAKLLRIVGITLLMCAGGGCDSTTAKSGALPWGPKHMTELVSGPYRIPIPESWRSLSELQDKSMQLPDGTVAMTPERLDQGAMRSNMNFAWAALPSTAGLPTCEQYAQAFTKPHQATASDVATFSIDGERGCRFRITMAEATQRQVVLFRGDHELAATWTRMTSLGSADADGDRDVWERTLAGFHVPKT